MSPFFGSLPQISLVLDRRWFWGAVLPEAKGLDVAQAQAEDVLQPHGVTDDLGQEAMAMIRAGLGRHLVSFIVRHVER